MPRELIARWEISQLSQRLITATFNFFEKKSFSDFLLKDENFYV